MVTWITNRGKGTANILIDRLCGKWTFADLRSLLSFRLAPPLPRRSKKTLKSVAVLAQFDLPFEEKDALAIFIDT